MRKRQYKQKSGFARFITGVLVTAIVVGVAVLATKEFAPEFWQNSVIPATESALNFFQK